MDTRGTFWNRTAGALQAKAIELQRLALYQCVHDGTGDGQVDIAGYMRTVLGVHTIPGVAVNR